MQKNIHPEFMTTKVTCACGNTFEISSNVPTLSVDVCDKCHPFYTGEQFKGRHAGKVDKFNRKYNLKSDE